MNAPMRSKYTQGLVRRALSSSTTPKREFSTLPSPNLKEMQNNTSSTSDTRSTNRSNKSAVSWNGNILSAVGATRKVSVTSSAPSSANKHNGINDLLFQEDEFPMKLANFIQRRNGKRQQQQQQSNPSLQEKWAKLASLTMDPCIEDVSDALSSRESTRTKEATNSSSLPNTLTQAMADPRPCIITLLDDPFVIVNVNQAWCQVYGYTKSEALHQNVVRLLGGDLEDFVLDQLLFENESEDESTNLPQQHHQSRVAHHTRDGTLVEEELRVGTLSMGADVSHRYLVCVTEKDAASTPNHSSGATSNPGTMRHNVEEEPVSWGQMGLV